MRYVFSEHQVKQLEVIEKIESQIKNGKLQLSTVSAVDYFNSDPRICLTSVHFPKQDLIDNIQKELLQPLKDEFPGHYYYRPTSLHITVKNIRVINNPPHFSNKDISRVKKMYSQVIPLCNSFKVYFYRLFFFPMNLALMGTTEPELDNILLRLDRKLTQIGVPDDKKYVNASHFFSNMTLIRFSTPITEKFKRKAKKIFKNIRLRPYKVDSVTLIKANASLVSCERIQSWNLK